MQGAGKIKTTKPGEGRGILPNRKFGMDTATSGSVQYYAPQILSATDYYAFGAPLPGRYEAVRDTGYRFGFNGQEKDNEITGIESSHTTAMFWEYDSRIGRRWNTDPIKKSNLSPYASFSNDPINKIDPNGDDDFYDRNGKLLKRTPFGNSVYVVNSSNAVFYGIYDAMLKKSNGKDINWKSMNYALSYYATALPDLDVNKYEAATRNIIWRYYIDLGYAPDKVTNFGLIESSDCDCAAWSYGPPETYQFAKKNGRLMSYVQNSDDVKSLWNHEYYHRQLQVGSTKSDATAEGRSVHLGAYYYEVTQDAFKNVSSAFREHTIGNISSYLGSINEDDLKTWKPKFEKALGGTFSKNKNNEYEFTSNE